MNQDAIAEYITNTFSDVATQTAYGYLFYFFGSNRKMPFATIATKDAEHETYSNLQRPGVFRLNIGVKKVTYRAMFGDPPKASEAVATPKGDYDYTELDKLLPHPEYAAQSWVCVLNPGPRTLQTVKELLAESHEIATSRGGGAQGEVGSASA